MSVKSALLLPLIPTTDGRAYNYLRTTDYQLTCPSLNSFWKSLYDFFGCRFFKRRVWVPVNCKNDPKATTTSQIYIRATLLDERKRCEDGALATYEGLEFALKAKSQELLREADRLFNIPFNQRDKFYNSLVASTLKAIDEFDRILFQVYPEIKDFDDLDDILFQASPELGKASPKEDPPLPSLLSLLREF